MFDKMPATIGAEAMANALQGKPSNDSDIALADALQGYVDINHDSIMANDTADKPYFYMIQHMIDSELGLIPVDSKAFITTKE